MYIYVVNSIPKWSWNLMPNVRELQSKFSDVWVKEMKYLGVTIVSSRNFKISTEESRRAFHRAANAIIWLHRQSCYGRSCAAIAAL